MHLDLQVTGGGDAGPAFRANQHSGASGQDEFPFGSAKVGRKPALAADASVQLNIGTQANRAKRTSPEPRMRRVIVLALLHLSLMGVGWTNREVVFAYPDEAPAQAVYRWGQDIVTSGIPLSAAIHKAQVNGGSQSMEVRLLHRDGAEETLYRLDFGSTQRALRWSGAADRRLVFRGQIDRSGQGSRPRTVVVGRSLKETLCFITDIDLCALA